MARRVDFSLGMQDVSSGDLMSDLYDDRSRSRVPSGIRADRIDEEAEAGAATATGRANSSDGPRQGHGGLARRSTSISSNVTHRNRFFDRLGRVGSRHTGPNHTAEPDLMEQGRIDPRSGTSQNQAVHDDTQIRNAGIAHSQTEDFEMRRMQH